MPQLSLDLSEGVATVTITNPPLATMDADTVSEIAELMPRLQEADVRAVVFTGGLPGFFIRHYSVVALDEAAQGQATRPARRPVNLHDLLLEIENLPKVVIAALNGTAMGGGWEFAMAADIRVAKDGPHRFGIAEVSSVGSCSAVHPAPHRPGGPQPGDRDDAARPHRAAARGPGAGHDRGAGGRGQRRAPWTAPAPSPPRSPPALPSRSPTSSAWRGRPSRRSAARCSPSRRSCSAN